ncbi:MAG: PilZ domain-containing protein [Desulfobacterales bacterium]|nr:PilZ domain-containing protein [Desulfobacterales bacterium]
MNLKAEDQRTAPRICVQFRAMVSGSAQPEGIGIILDLSRSGCRLESPLLMLPGLSLELRIAVPGLEWALTIDGADVQWANEEIAGLAFVRIREAEQQRLDDVMTTRLARKFEDGGEEHSEVVPFEFQGLEPVLSKNPELAISKGLAWFAQDRAEFWFRGGSLLSRAFPTCTPEFAAALGELVKAGGDTEADFSLAILQNYLGPTSTHGVLKEIVSRFPHDASKMDGVRISINSTGVVSGEFGLAEAWRVKKESLTRWLTDERQAVTAFAEQHMAELDRMIVAERRRVEAERERRERSRHEEESGHDHGYRPKPF